MHIAIGYHWFPHSGGYHIERAWRDLGHTVTYVGLPHSQRPGYDSSIPITQIVASLSQPADLYLWIDPAGRYFPPGIEDLPIPTACYLIDVHLGTWREEAARFFDAVFVAQKDYVERFHQAIGHDQVAWLPLAAAPDVHRKLDFSHIYDVGFVGSMTLAHRKTARARRLKLITERFHTNDFYRPYAPDEVGQVYSQSRIVFNTSIAGDVTMRIFEGTACGALMLTDSIANGLGELFEIGQEIITYTDDADLLDKIAYYLAHEKERAQIAHAGHQRTQAQHTYAHRTQKIIETITAPDFQHQAPMRRATQKERFAARRIIYTHLYMLDTILDEARAAGYNPIQRAWAIAPCLARRLLL
jgi:hypothetical protein